MVFLLVGALVLGGVYCLKNTPLDALPDLSDVQVTASTLSPLHAVIWLLNGSAAVVMNPYPITPAVSKMFGEQFYSSLSVELDPSPAYQKAVTYLGKKREAREGFAGASYLYYGVR